MGFKEVGQGVQISRNACFYGKKKISIGNHVRIDDFCLLSGNIQIGSYVHISPYTSLVAGSECIQVCDFVSISSKCSIFSKSDDFSGIAMTNPMVPEKYRNVYEGKVILNKHSIIGAGCVVLPDVILGTGGAIGAMSLVNKNVESWTVSYRHITSSYPPRENIISGAITIVNITDFYGKGSVIEKELFNGFESINITNPAYKYLNVILEIEEKSYRFVALYQYLTEGKSIKQFIEWLEKEEILEKYNISIKKNPSKEYENCNPELDDLSYLRTIIAHYQTEKSDKWTKEYNEMIDKNICKIISIIKEYK